MNLEARGLTVVEPEPTFTKANLLVEMAKKHHSSQKMDKMKLVVARMDPEDQIPFYKDHECFQEAADLMRNRGLPVKV